MLVVCVIPFNINIRPNRNAIVWCSAGFRLCHHRRWDVSVLYVCTSIISGNFYEQQPPSSSCDEVGMDHVESGADVYISLWWYATFDRYRCRFCVVYKMMREAKMTLKTSPQKNCSSSFMAVIIAIDAKKLCIFFSASWILSFVVLQFFFFKRKSIQVFLFFFITTNDCEKEVFSFKI